MWEDARRHGQQSALSTHSGSPVPRCRGREGTRASPEEPESLQGPSAWPPACGHTSIEDVTALIKGRCGVEDASPCVCAP